MRLHASIPRSCIGLLTLHTDTSCVSTPNRSETGLSAEKMCLAPAVPAFLGLSKGRKVLIDLL